MQLSISAFKNLTPPDELIYKRIETRALHLYYVVPDDVKSKTVMAFVHGGGFTGGTPDFFFPHARYFATLGVPSFSIEYRLLQPGISLIDALTDVSDALVFLRKDGERFHIDVGRICLIGESAGGYFATALPTIADRYGMDPKGCPDLIVNCNGVVDLTDTFYPYSRYRSDVDREQASEAPGIHAHNLSPTYQIDGNLPPLLNLQGDQDPVVPPEKTKRFHELWKKAGGNSTYVHWADVSHAFILTDYHAEDWQVDRALQEIYRFIQDDEGEKRQ